MLKISKALNKFRRAKACIALVLAAAALPMAGCIFSGRAEEELITIGAIFPLSNDFSTNGVDTVLFGIHSAFGAHVAKEAINSGGGVLGKNMDLIILNGGGNLLIAKERYRELKEQRGAVAIVGPPLHKIANELAKMAEEDGTPFILQGASAEMTAARRDYYKAHIATEALNKTYYVNFGSEPHPAASAACECVCMLADALEKSGGAGSKEIIAAINDISHKILSNPKDSKHLTE